MVVPIQLAQLPPITEMGLGTIRHANGRPEISRNAYLATELIACCSICQAAETSVYIDRKRSRLTSKQQTNGCGPNGPGMTGCCFHPTATTYDDREDGDETEYSIINRIPC
jgi:hypothetical protein